MKAGLQIPKREQMSLQSVVVTERQTVRTLKTLTPLTSGLACEPVGQADMPAHAMHMVHGRVMNPRPH